MLPVANRAPVVASPYTGRFQLQPGKARATRVAAPQEHRIKLNTRSTACNTCTPIARRNGLHLEVRDLDLAGEVGGEL